MEAESSSILWCLSYCSSRNIQNIIVEIDSLSLQKIIRGIWKIPWHIREHIEEIRAHIEGIQTEIKHIFREANNLANSLANHAFDKVGRLQYHTFQDLAIQSKKAINIYKAQILSLRIKTRPIKY